MTKQIYKYKYSVKHFTINCYEIDGNADKCILIVGSGAKLLLTIH